MLATSLQPLIWDHPYFENYIVDASILKKLISNFNC